VLAWAAAFRQLHDGAYVWCAAHLASNTAARTQQHLISYHRTCPLSQQHAQIPAPSYAVLTKRLLRHQDELFQFVVSAGSLANNNPVQHRIRHLVALHTISDGSRAADGKATRFSLAGLFDKPFRLQKPRPYATLTFAFVQASTLAVITIITFESSPALLPRVSSILVVPYTTSSGRSQTKYLPAGRHTRTSAVANPAPGSRTARG